MSEAERYSPPAASQGAGKAAASAEAGHDGAGKPAAPDGPQRAGKGGNREDRLASALRANLGRRKAARRAGLDAFGASDGDDGE